ncbi:hypothetical protein GCM10010168_77160 [Actinoplanes ianthinogenes]|uniref:Integral membrane protein n=1 Tax=Actinoplanes ianthinogenes TaxID=122358 RepID=A0ABM7M9Q8_9ACTN|nr:hypothetical protein [Actinoplanes ianthinogenes]BCJ48358.1 hypothetical protein Aiant_90150 [Actinoplanes ianthinogenes]GGR46921.1 hypothetical protein GCM10010168_77160 [Actinoplanes ianthinogenes]
MRAVARLTTRSRLSWPSSRADRRTLVAALGLVAVAILVGAALGWIDHPVRAPAAPLFAHVLPHAGPGTPFAVLIAWAVLRWGPELAERLPWRRLLTAAWLTAVAWTFALALVDGWQRGVAGRLTTRFEYLSEVPGVTDVPAMLRGFTSRILLHSVDNWAEHVSGHPPGPLLVFVALDRLGLGGGGWAALLCVLAGAGAVVAVAVTLRALGDEEAARAAIPFLVLFPGAVWIGVSADGMFAGVAAGALALLAIGLSRPSRWCLVAGGAGLAACAYLSYGLVLLALPAAAVIVLRLRRFPLLAWAGLGAGVVVTVMTLLGFNWWDGYQLVQQRYYQGLASARPYAYWVWANLAALTICAGPAAAIMLRRAAAAVVTTRTPAVLLCLGAAAAVVAADLSGLSKAETERIWLPFAIWLPAAAALVPSRDRRGWLLAQAGTALLVNHLVLTSW